MGYPVAAYRTNGQTKRPSATGGGYQKPPAPANDNFRPPANDNWRPFPKPKPPAISPFGKAVPRGALEVARRSRPLAKLLTRGVPVLGTAMLIYDVGDFALRWTPGLLAVWFWEVVSDCGRTGFSYTAQSTPCGNIIGDAFSPGPYGRPMPIGGS